jgi:hypothetical protein
MRHKKILTMFEPWEWFDTRQILELVHSSRETVPFAGDTVLFPRTEAARQVAATTSLCNDHFVQRQRR